MAALPQHALTIIETPATWFAGVVVSLLRPTVSIERDERAAREADRALRKTKKRAPEDAPYLVLSKLVNSQTAFSELLGSATKVSPNVSLCNTNQASRSNFNLMHRAVGIVF